MGLFVARPPAAVHMMQCRTHLEAGAAGCWTRQLMAASRQHAWHSCRMQWRHFGRLRNPTSKPGGGLRSWSIIAHRSVFSCTPKLYSADLSRHEEISTWSEMCARGIPRACVAARQCAGMDQLVVKYPCMVPPHMCLPDLRMNLCRTSAYARLLWMAMSFQPWKELSKRHIALKAVQGYSRGGALGGRAHLLDAGLVEVRVPDQDHALDAQQHLHRVNECIFTNLRVARPVRKIQMRCVCSVLGSAHVQVPNEDHALDAQQQHLQCNTSGRLQTVCWLQDSICGIWRTPSSPDCGSLAEGSFALDTEQPLRGVQQRSAFVTTLSAQNGSQHLSAASDRLRFTVRSAAWLR